MGAILSTLGLVASLGGVVLLFRYGMPYERRTGGGVHLALEQNDSRQARREVIYHRLGLLGLILIFVGTAFQAAGVWYGQK